MTIALELRKRADQLGLRLSEPPQHHPDALLMRRAADIISDSDRHVFAAFLAGWRVNAVEADDLQDQAYLDRCARVDFLEWQKAQGVEMLASSATGVGTMTITADEFDRLKAQNERMRQALEPFALIASEGVVKQTTGHVSITTSAEYFHAAADALKGDTHGN